MADEQGAEHHKISNVMAGFMIGLAMLLDGLQFLLTLTVLLSLFSELITFFALCIFGVWFALLRVNYFSGKSAGLKLISTIGSAVIELIPFIDGVPAITAGVSGVILATRLEERKAIKPAVTNTLGSIRLSGPQKITAPANDNGEEYVEAA